MSQLQPPCTDPVISEANLVAPISTVVDLGPRPVRLSAHAVVTNSAASVGNFDDGVLASGTFTITSFAAAHFTAAHPSGTITIPTVLNLNDGDTVTLTGLPVDGTKVFVRQSVIVDPTTEWTVLADLTALIDGLASLSATDNGVSVITVVCVTKGAAFNTVGGVSPKITGSGTAPLPNLAVTFSGGIDAAVVTVDGHALVESTDWNSVTNNNTAADNLAAAIDALANVSAANPAAAVITVKAVLIGTAGNALTTVVAGGGVTTQQAHLTGGTNSDVDGTAHTITIVGHGYSTDLKVNYDKVTGTTITNLVDNTDYWVIKIDDDTIQLAASSADALAGTEIAIADANDAVGGGTFTLTPTAVDADINFSESDDGVNFVILDSTNLSATGSYLKEYPTICSRYFKIEIDPNDSEIDLTVLLHAKL